MSDATERNRAAWNAGRYAAWVEALGAPAEEAARIVANPSHTPRRVLPHLGEVRRQRICHLQGSHGRIATSLARLGAEVTVIDFAEENRRYALQLAEAAGVSIDYRLCDVMQAGGLGLDGTFDALVLELGVFHYHQDLDGFFAVVAALVRPGGRLVVNEFHPVQRKLFQPGAPRDYFRSDLLVAEVPNPTADGRTLGNCAYRHWTLGEIVTAAIAAGFQIERLEEHPDWTDATIPGTFTLVATKAAPAPRPSPPTR